MTETILIKSKRSNVKKVAITILVIGIVIGMMVGLVGIPDLFDVIESFDEHDHGKYCYKISSVTGNKYLSCKYSGYSSGFDYAFSEYYINYFLVALLMIVGFGVLALIVYYCLCSYELVVSDKRIYGKISWGKRVDLPLDSISATSLIQTFKGVSVSTSSGKINFLLLENADEIYNEISNLIINRQKEEPGTSNISVDSQNNDSADFNEKQSVEALREFKKLLDDGIITEEEFEAKKKQILGLNN